MGQDRPESLDQGWLKPGPGRKIPVNFLIREKNVTSFNKQKNKQLQPILGRYQYFTPLYDLQSKTISKSPPPPPHPVLPGNKQPPSYP
jgi:hypothetical protein